MKADRRTLLIAALLAGAPILIFGIALSGQNAAPAAAKPVRIELQPVIAGGLAQPVFVTNPHDGSDRLFIIEQPGRIRVLQPGAATATTFLDISASVLAGGEQGLLGLAFHPQYVSNRRFFVDYTRRSDGATVVAEYHASASNPNLADPSESVLLVIPQPYANHNGGMIEFGPDGYLYIGMGDGGSGNDPENRAQNPQELLGKILRIDVDRMEGGMSYGIPPSNPYHGLGSARQEIFALGLRNPWRYSFDRETGRLFAGDVGQNEVEEVDVITAGGNYGWRVLEGTRCTNLGPAPCSSAVFAPPIAEYTHSLGRCSITGGYVYRGSGGSLPFGAYVYGDFCTGEIFMLESGSRTLLLDTGFNLSSFGEDENGEIYVVDLGGAVSRIINPDAPPQPSYYFPRLVTTAGRPTGGNESTGFAATNLDHGVTALKFTAYDTNGALIQGPNISNPATLQLQGGAQTALLDTQVFGPGLRSQDRLGWVRLESSTARLAAFFLAFDAQLSLLDGANAGPILHTRFILPEAGPPDLWQVHMANPHADSTEVSLELRAGDGSSRTSVSRTLAPNQVAVESVAGWFPGFVVGPTDYVRGTSTQGVAALEFLEKSGQDARAIEAQDATAGGTVLFGPQYAVGEGYQSSITVTNLESTAGSITFQLYKDNGTPAGNPRALPIAANGKVLVTDAAFFGDFGPSLTQGHLKITSNGPLLAGSVTCSDSSGRGFSTTLPLISDLEPRLVYSQVASDTTYYTGVSFVNPGAVAAKVRIDVVDSAGRMLASGDFSVPASGRMARLLTEYFPSLIEQSIGGGYLRITADRSIASCAVFGTNNRSALSAIPATILR